MIVYVLHELSLLKAICHATIKTKCIVRILWWKLRLFCFHIKSNKAHCLNRVAWSTEKQILPFQPNTIHSASKSTMLKCWEYKESHRFVIFKCGFKLAQGHVGGGSPIVALNVVLVQLQGSRGVRQRIAIALGAQVRQTPVTVVDGIARVQLHCFRVELDGVLIVFIWNKSNEDES